MPLESGTLVYVELSARVKDTGELVETTSEEEAKKEGVYDAARRYSARLVSVGKGWVLKGLDEALQAAEVGEEKTIEILPEKAFGPRDPAKTKLVPLRKLGERASGISVGEEVEVDGQVAVVRFVGSGRVQLDFNHRMAGKTLVYRFNVVKTVGEDKERVLALLRYRLPLEKEEGLDVAIENGIAKIRLPSEVYLIGGVQYAKKAVAGDIFAHVSTVKEVHFVEVYQSPHAEAKPTPPPAPEKVGEAAPQAGDTGTSA